MAISSEYREYLQSDRWNTIRGYVLERADYACEHCGAEDEVLQVHHKTYANIYDESPSDLVALCVDCHEKADKARRAERVIRIPF